MIDAHEAALGAESIPFPTIEIAPPDDYAALNCAIACIGPITAQTARDAGLPVDVMAAEYTMDGLVAALANYFAHPGNEIKENRWIPRRSLPLSG